MVRCESGGSSSGMVVAALIAIAMPAGRPALAAPPAPKAAAVSFSRQVAPILVTSCGGCHVTGRKGGFQMASHEGLMRTGMVQRGQGQASRLVEVILTGDMPRGGGRVSSADVATLIAWIDAGAPCDAPNPALPLETVARGGGAAPRPAMPVARATAIKPGDVSFATDVAPLLQEHCLRCHGGDETEAALSMATLAALVKGGRTGVAVVTGKANESLLVKKLRGEGIEGQRMPLGRPPLSDTDVALIARWIDQGARLDMLTATTPLDALVAGGRAKTLTDADLAHVRFRAGEKLWRRVIPDEVPGVAERAGVCAIGTLPPDRLSAVADLAHEIGDEVRGTVGMSGPLLKGGIVLYAVERAIDYSAIWQNVANTERPRGLNGHAGVAGDVAYAALLVPANQSDDELRAGLADVLTTAAFAGRAAPGWFCQGAGRAVAGRLAPKSKAVQQWRRDVTAALPRLGSTADLLAGHADPAATAVAAGGLLAALAGGDKLGRMAAALDDGAPFDEAFLTIFRISPAQAFEKWAARVAR